MPYIDQKIRDLLDPDIKEIVDTIKTFHTPTKIAGVLNYVFTKIVVSLWSKCRTYHMGNNIVGALHCVAYEFVRRHLNVYEDEKIEENGDVHPL